MLVGRWRDVVRDARGAPLRTGVWRSNVIVDTAWTLMAAHLRGTEGLGGIRQVAVGIGDPTWDTARPVATSGTTRLHREVRRAGVAGAAMRYLDADGEETDAPSSTLEVSVEIPWEEGITLREFGLFGGDATGAEGSGWMVNYVVHAPLELEAGQRLTRTVRLSFGRGATADAPLPSPTLPRHWLGAFPVDAVEGVGPAYRAALEQMGVESLADLAAVDPGQAGDGLPRTRLMEFRARARIALRTASELRVPAALLPLVSTAITTRPAPEIAREAGIGETDVRTIREEVALLEASLDHATLSRLTLGDLSGPGPNR
jgi:hypothetical protein